MRLFTDKIHLAPRPKPNCQQTLVMPKLNPEVHSYFDEATNAACYIVKDPTSVACAVID